MSDRQAAHPLSVRMSRDDRRWLTQAAAEADLSVDLLVIRAVRHLRSWEEKGRKALEEVLACIDDVFCEHEGQLRRQREYYERRIRAERIRLARARAMRMRAATHGGAAAGQHDVLSNRKIVKLVTLALCSSSESEASAAFAKARALHRLAALSHQPPGGDQPAG